MCLGRYICPGISDMVSILEAATYGIYVHPLARGRQQVLAFDTESLYPATSVRTNVSPLTSMHRPALETTRVFGYAIRPEGIVSVLGTAIRINEPFGLAPPTWHLASLTHHPMDLGISVDASSDDDDTPPVYTW